MKFCNHESLINKTEHVLTRTLWWWYQSYITSMILNIHMRV